MAKLLSDCSFLVFAASEHEPGSFLWLRSRKHSCVLLELSRSKPSTWSHTFSLFVLRVMTMSQQMDYRRIQPLSNFLSSLSLIPFSYFSGPTFTSCHLAVQYLNLLPLAFIFSSWKAWVAFLLGPNMAQQLKAQTWSQHSEMKTHLCI